MGRPKGSKNRVTVTFVEESKEGSKSEWTEAEWTIAEELNNSCSTPGCTPKVHLFQARRIMEIVKRNG
jgi:hypothetical protein